MAEIEGLSFTITADVSKATTELQNVQNSIANLERALGNLRSTKVNIDINIPKSSIQALKNFNDVAKRTDTGAIYNLSQALSQLQSVGQVNFSISKSSLDSLNSLYSIATQWTQDVNASITRISTAIKTLAGASNVDFSISPTAVNSLATILQIAQNFSQDDANKINKVSTAISRLGKVTQLNFTISPTFITSMKGVRDELTRWTDAEIARIQKIAQALNRFRMLGDSLTFGIDPSFYVSMDELRSIIGSFSDDTVKKLNTIAKCITNLEKIGNLKFNIDPSTIQALSDLHDAVSQWTDEDAKKILQIAVALKQLGGSGKGASNNNKASNVFEYLAKGFKDITTWTAAIKAVSDSVSGLASGLVNLSRSMMNTVQSSTTFKGMLHNIVSASEQAFESLGQIVGGLISTVGGVVISLAVPMGFLAGIPLALSGVKQVVSGITSGLTALLQAVVSVGTYVLSTTAKIATAPFGIVSSALQGMVNGLKSFVASAKDKALESLPEVLHAIIEPVEAVKNGLASAAKTLEEIIPGLETVKSILGTLGLNGLTRLFGSLISRVYRTIATNMLKAFSEGIENLYYYGGVFAETMDTCATEMQYLKNSIAAMLAPALNALAPLIEYVVDAFVDLINVVNQLMALLTGASFWTKATKQAAAYKTATSGAAGSTKDLADALDLLSFDEINKLSENDTSSGSGGGSGSSSDYSSMFSTEQLDVDPDSIIGQISTMINNIKEAFTNGDWEGCGTALATGLNGIVSTANDWVTNTFTPFATTWASNIAGILNGAIGNLDFSNLGTLVANSLNGIASTIQTFFTEFDGESLGEGIGTFFTSLFSGVDADTVGGAIAAVIKDGVETTVSLLNSTDFGTIITTIGTTLSTAMKKINLATLCKNLGTALTNALKTYQKGKTNFGTIIANAINTAVKGIKAFLSTDAIKTAATTLATDVKSLFDGIDWDTLMTTFGTLLTSVFNGISTFLGSFDWSEVGTKVASSLKAFLSSDFLSGLGSSFASTLNNVLTAAEAFTDTFTTEDWEDLGDEIGTSISDFFASDNFTQAADIINSLIEGIQAFWDSDGMETAKTSVVDALSQLFGNIDMDSARSTFEGFIEDIADEIKTTLKTYFFGNGVSNNGISIMGNVVVNGGWNWGNYTSLHDSWEAQLTAAGYSSDGIYNAELAIGQYMTDHPNSTWSEALSACAKEIQEALGDPVNVEVDATADKQSASKAGSAISSSAQRNTSAVTVKGQAYTGNCGQIATSIMDGVGPINVNVSGKSDTTNHKTIMNEIVSALGTGYAPVQGQAVNANSWDHAAVMSSIISAMGTGYAPIEGYASVGNAGTVATDLVTNIKQKIGPVAVKAEADSSNASSVASSLATAIKNAFSGISVTVGIEQAKFKKSVSGVEYYTTSFSSSLVYKNATGGFVNAATLFGGNNVVGEAGREAIVPLENNLGYLDKWADVLVSKMSSSGAGSTPVVVQVNLDGKVVGKSAVQYINTTARTTGNNPLSAYI